MGRVPAHAKTVWRASVFPGVLYVVPPGRTLVVTGAWVSAAQPAASAAFGWVAINAPSEDNDTDTTLVCLALNSANNATNNAGIAGMEVRVKAGAQVSLVKNGAVTAVIVGGFNGFLE